MNPLKRSNACASSTLAKRLCTNNDIYEPEFKSIQLYTAFGPMVETEEKDGRFLSDIDKSLIQYLSHLRIQEAQSQHEPLEMSLATVLQNRDLLSDFKRVSAPQGTQHFLELNFRLPIFQDVMVHWRYDQPTAVQHVLCNRRTNGQSNGQRTNGESINGDTSEETVDHFNYSIKLKIDKDNRYKGAEQVIYVCAIHFSPPIKQSHFQALCHQSREYAYERLFHHVNHIETFTGTETEWQRLNMLPKRSMQTVYLPDALKKDMMLDIDRFASSREFYSSHGIPYKRVYLFEGPPGLGKTSLIEALASHYSMNICVLSFNRAMDDSHFMSRISDMPDDSMLLLEDIDALGLSNEEDAAKRTSLSFSCVLNTLDGISRKDGMIVFLTANAKDRLAEALLRVGRIDKILKFDYIKKPEAKQMFLDYIPPESHSQMDAFFHKLSLAKVTPAMLQKFFMEKRLEQDIVKQLPYLNEIKQSVIRTQDVRGESMMG